MKETMRKISLLGGVLIIFSILYYILLRLPIDKIMPIYTYKGMLLLAVDTILLIITGIILVKKSILKIDVKDMIITV